MTRRRLFVLTLLALTGRAADAQTARNVRVSVEFRHAGAAGRDGAGAGGGVIVTERGGLRTRIRGGAETTDVLRRSSTGVFTLVQDGGEATLVVATQVPRTHVAFYRDYATGHGHVAAGIVFRDVGTALNVRAHVLPDGRIRVRLTPRISWFSADGAGKIDVTEAETNVIVPNGQPVVVAASSTETHTVTRQVLGLGQERTSGETTVVLTATVQL